MIDVLPKYVIGLGNPGAEYAETRHNVGFQVVGTVETLCEIKGRFRRHKSKVTECRTAGRTFWLFRPQTFMNNSGRAVQALCHVRDAEPAQILVVTDCVDLSFGTIRLRKKGGSGGHRGLQSIIDCLGTTDFPRLRVGIGHGNHPDMVRFVLEKWTPTEYKLLKDGRLETVANAVLTAVTHGMDMAMNRYNNLGPLENEGVEQ